MKVTKVFSLASLLGVRHYRKHRLLENLKWHWFYVKNKWKAEMFKSCFWYPGCDSPSCAITVIWGSAGISCRKSPFLHLTIPQRNFTHVTVYVSWIAAHLWKAWELCLLVRAQCSSGFHMARRKTCQLHLWARQLDNQTEHSFSVWVLLFGEGRGQAGYELQPIHAFLCV